MRLAQMLEVDEDAVVCDLAETYGVLDCEALPITLVATLADGLPDSSRIMRKLLRGSKQMTQEAEQTGRQASSRR